MEIRNQKVSLRKRIEEQANKLLHEPSIAEYLQDLYFTVRNEKYVIPIRLDGRGRIKGVVVDTSDSGQTLLLEPVQLAPMNEALHELEVAEKLEIIRIFRELSASIAQEVEVLSCNYNILVQLDCFTAEASLAQKLDAGPVNLVDQPILELYNARHPLILTPKGKGAEPNSIILNEGQKTLIVSGPNAGGKTVVLKTAGLLHLMLKAGLLVPADEQSKMFLFRNVYLEMGDAQNIMWLD
jgi:DNA mismatch repair protein MutS2